MRENGGKEKEEGEKIRVLRERKEKKSEREWGKRERRGRED